MKYFIHNAESVINATTWCVNKYMLSYSRIDFIDEKLQSLHKLIWNKFQPQTSIIAN